MDLKELKRLITMVEQAHITHLSVENEGTKIEIKKELEKNGVNPTTQIIVPNNGNAPVSEAPQPVEKVVDSAPAPKADVEDSTLTPLKAEMVGTFYTAPSPDAANFVAVGDTIKKGQVICIIEAMKLFNEIESDIEGVIEKVCLKTGDAVEFGQPLFMVRTD